jgi:hypothetical protein
MFRSRVPSAIALCVLFCHPAVSYADAGLLRTIQPLDETRGYCLDIRGEGQTLQLDEPLQAHTCKYGAPNDDQRFERTADGAIRASVYNRCLAAAKLEAGAQLLVRPCASAPTQQWTMAWGRLSPASRSDLCVTVAGEKGEPAGTPILISPVYHRRDAVLDRCDAAREATQSFRWSLPQERGLSTAETARNGMPADVAAQLIALRPAADSIPQTYKIYAAQPHVYEASEIKVAKNIAYGPHERQQIDIHTATVRRAPGRVPVVAVFHGGGLIAGSRANTTTVADYFASIGLVGVNAGYRLAPDSKWPEGHVMSPRSSRGCTSMSPSTAATPTRSSPSESPPARCTRRCMYSGRNWSRPRPRVSPAPSSVRGRTRLTSQIRRWVSSPISAATRHAGRRWWSQATSVASTFPS